MITYTFTDTNGCENSATANVVVNALPVVSVSGGPFCVDDAASNLTGSPAGGTFSGTGVSAAGSFDPVTAGVGSHVITYTFTDTNGCENSATVNVVVNGLPSINIQATTPVCAQDTIQLSEDAGDAASWSWTGPNGFNSNFQSPIIPNATSANAGIYTVMVSNEEGCTASISTEVVVNSLPNINISSSPICPGDTLFFSENGGDAISWSWTGPNGFSSSLQSPFIPVGEVQNSGIYSVEIEDSNGCVQTSNVSAIVYPLPEVSTIEDTTIICMSNVDLSGLVTQLTSESVTTTFHNTIGDAESGINAIPGTVAPTSTTKYFVRNTSSNNCLIIDSLEINVNCFFDLALTKQINATATPPPYAPGDVVQFTIEVFNQGTLDAYDIDVADYVPAGLGPVTLVSGQSGVTQNAVNDFTVDFVGAGLSTTFEVEATIASNFMGSSLTNNAEITGGSDVDGGADATDADSTPGDNSMDPADPNDNSTGDGDGTSPQDDDFDPAEVLLTQVFDLALTKQINAGCLLYTSPSPRD